MFFLLQIGVFGSLFGVCEPGFELVFDFVIRLFKHCAETVCKEVDHPFQRVFVHQAQDGASDEEYRREHDYRNEQRVRAECGDDIVEIAALQVLDEEVVAVDDVNQHGKRAETVDRTRHEAPGIGEIEHRDAEGDYQGIVDVDIEVHFALHCARFKPYVVHCNPHCDVERRRARADYRVDADGRTEAFSVEFEPGDAEIDCDKDEQFEHSEADSSNPQHSEAQHAEQERGDCELAAAHFGDYCVEERVYDIKDYVVGYEPIVLEHGREELPDGGHCVRAEADCDDDDIPEHGNDENGRHHGDDLVCLHPLAVEQKPGGNDEEQHIADKPQPAQKSSDKEGGVRRRRKIVESLSRAVECLGHGVREHDEDYREDSDQLDGEMRSFEVGVESDSGIVQFAAARSQMSRISAASSACVPADSERMCGVRPYLTMTSARGSNRGP